MKEKRKLMRSTGFRRSRIAWRTFSLTLLSLSFLWLGALATSSPDAAETVSLSHSFAAMHFFAIENEPESEGPFQNSSPRHLRRSGPSKLRAQIGKSLTVAGRVSVGASASKALLSTSQIAGSSSLSPALRFPPMRC